MSAHAGEQLATLLDKGLSLLPLLPNDHIVSIEASYMDESGMLKLEQSPYLSDPHSARLRILGSVAGMGTYGDESKFIFALSNNVSLPDGTHVQLKEPEPIQGHPDYYYRLTNTALDAGHAISDFVRTIEGDLRAARLGFDTSGTAPIDAKVNGVFSSEEMKTAYLRTLGNGIIANEHSEPTTGRSVARIVHTVLTPASGQVITFSMSDHRPGIREEMLRLRREET